MANRAKTNRIMRDRSDRRPDGKRDPRARARDQRRKSARKAKHASQER